MKYEMDFIGIQEETQDADAICFRYYDEALGRYVVCVYDGGLEAYGTPLKNHLNEYYFNDLNDEEQPRIDCDLFSPTPGSCFRIGRDFRSV